MSDILHVTMLGTFSLQRGNHYLDDRSNRMRKVWLLLAYLIYSRSNHPSQNNFLNLLDGSESADIGDPAGRLKTIFYRTRAMLDQLDGNAGHELIIHRNGNYAWNTEIPLQLDTEEFEKLCARASSATEEEEQLSLSLQALELYQGDFLPKLSMEFWVMPISVYFHQMFLDTLERTLPQLESRERWVEEAVLCRRALQIEPYRESIYQHLMLCYLKTGNRAAVLSLYDEMSKLLFSAFGVIPSEESRQLYREASRETNGTSLPISAVREQLREPTQAQGAMYCEYDFFKLLYQVEARSILRSGETIHIALLSVQGFGSKPLSRRSLDLAMNNLQEIITKNLRQGDVFTRCSASQVVIMLPQANYENSCMVCLRIIRAFSRQYPHSPAEICYNVQPLEPMMPSTGP